MKNQFLNSRQILASLFSALLVFTLSLSLKAQCVSPPACEAISVTPNPSFPGCKAPEGVPFRVLVILDESGSISDAGATATVRNAVNGFANLLNSLTASTGKVEMGIIEFSNAAANGLAPSTYVDVKDGTFLTKVQTYLSTGYNPLSANCTNFEAALNQATSFPRADIIFFITDGVPTKGNVNPSAWASIANTLKSAPTSTYIFAIGVGSGICKQHLQNLSGPDELNNPLTFQGGADWTLESFSSLGQGLIDLANSLIDTQAPTLTCSLPVKVVNDLGKCGSIVTFNTQVNDNCPNATASCIPPSGSFFNVGQTTVNCKAKDNVGNESTCSFKITVLDLEAPKITCPANKLISCEESSLPANTGTPITSDNCAVATVNNADLRIDGACLNEFKIERTWTVVDANGNMNQCLQTISVEDKKPPVIQCPANITVECDTSVAKTGKATATDNCDTDVSMVWSNIHISGDCDWFCITERHWTATDDCGNFSKCVQVITKDVTPLIEKALEAGPLVWGQTAATVTLPPGKGACVVKWLPYVGVVPTALKFDDAVAGADCKLMTNPLDRNTGQIVNPLLGEAMKLKILVRLNPSLGTRKVKQILDAQSPPCTMHFIVRQALGGGDNATVNELLRVTDLTLGNVNVNLLVPEHAMHLLNVLKCVNAGRSVCNNP